MASSKDLEEKLNEIFVKKAPYQLPEEAKKIIVKYLPYISLFFGIFTLWAAYNLYQWATYVNEWVDVANNLAQTLGSSAYIAPTSRLTMTVWLGVIVLTIEGVLWVASFPGTKARAKSGWNLLFLALIINAIYGLVSLFIDTGGVGSLIGYVVSTTIGLYFLFQIRSYYLPGRNVKVSKVKEEPKKPVKK